MGPVDDKSVVFYLARLVSSYFSGASSAYSLVCYSLISSQFWGFNNPDRRHELRSDSCAELVALASAPVSVN